MAAKVAGVEPRDTRERTATAGKRPTKVEARWLMRRAGYDTAGCPSGSAT